MENLNSQGKDLVTINYKETTIVLKSGDKVTLSVTDKKLTEDVVITSVLPEETIVWDGSYTIEDAISLISFTIAGTTYEAEDGMTWQQWTESSYNTDGWYVALSRVYSNSGLYFVDNVAITDVIMSGGTYATTQGGAVD